MMALRMLLAMRKIQAFIILHDHTHDSDVIFCDSDGYSNHRRFGVIIVFFFVLVFLSRLLTRHLMILYVIDGMRQDSELEFCKGFLTVCSETQCANVCYLQLLRLPATRCQRRSAAEAMVGSYCSLDMTPPVQSHSAS